MVTRGLQYAVLLLVLTASARAQTVPPPVPPEPALGIPDTSDAAVMPASSMWVVSTHHSPQSFDDTCPRFRPGVMQYLPGCGYHQADFQQLIATIQPGIPVCIAVHGSFVSWEDVCYEARGTGEWLRRDCPGLPLQFIWLTWPSDRDITPLVAVDACVLGRRAERNGYYLADLINCLPPDCPISLIGHSHGTRVVASALHLMGGGDVQGWRHRCASCSGRRIRAVFAASAMDHNWLNPGERYDRALCCTECLLNLYNGHDPALKIYPLRRPFARRALGCTGLTRNDRSKLQRSASRVRDLDVSRQLGMVHNWPEYFRRPSMATTIRHYVHFTDSRAVSTGSRP